MVIKNVSLETVIGVTSKIPQNELPEIALRQEQCGEILAHQCPDEPQITGAHQLAAGQDTDH